MALNTNDFTTNNNDIRSSGEISANYNLELAGNESNLVAYYPFETYALTTSSTSTSSSTTTTAL